MSANLYAVIMAGGGGTRLWPMSRQRHPKQILRLVGKRTLFEASVDRLLPLLPLERVFVVTASEQVAALAAQYPELPRENFIIEPMGRGTASCIGLAALHLHRIDRDGVMAVLTADHHVEDVEGFRACITAARAVADQGYLVTLGITPTYPATGYGYIRQGQHLGSVDGLDYHEVAAFVEKPELDRARDFLKHGGYSWNSGMFVWRTERILEEVARWMPELWSTLEGLDAAMDSGAYQARLSELWPALHKETIDYGIMERADRVAVIPVEIGWSDIGSWASVMSALEDDAAGNVLVGEVMDLETEETMVISSAGRLVVTIGLRDLIVVDTPDALLITRRELSQRVKEVVQRLRAEDRADLL